MIDLIIIEMATQSFLFVGFDEKAIKKLLNSKENIGKILLS